MFLFSRCFSDFCSVGRLLFLVFPYLFPYYLSNTWFDFLVFLSLYAVRLSCLIVLSCCCSFFHDVFFPRCFDPVAFLFFATNYFFCPFFLFLYAYYSRYCCFASVFLFSFMFRVSFFHNGFLSVCFFHTVFSFYFLSVYISFMHSFLCCFYTRTLVLLYMFYDIFLFTTLLIFFCFSSFFRMPGLLSFFCFLASSIGFLRIYAAPDIRTGSDRFVPSFPICFTNDRLIPYRSDVSIFSFICHGCFIRFLPLFFLLGASVFFRLCRLSVAFLSTFSSCLVRETSVRFSSVVPLVLPFFRFGLSVLALLFRFICFPTKKRISALFVCFTSFFRLLLLPL